MTIEKVEFPEGDFYIKSVTSPSGTSTSSAASQNYVLDLEKGYFFTSATKEGTKASSYRQKSDSEPDPYQIWRNENGQIINRKTDFALEVEGGKNMVFFVRV